MSIIRVRNLQKHFKIPIKQKGRLGALKGLFSLEREIKKAVDRVDFDIGRGEIVGYVGPNGAGKSTTIKMLTGILVPTAGDVEVAARTPHKERMQLARRIGVVFGQKTQLWWDVPVMESLRLLKEIYKIPDETYNRNLDIFNDLLDLDEFKDTPVRQLSLGQRMRSDLAAALLHDPEILFLDEPTIGVDVVAKERFRSFIRRLNREREVTVLLTTHDMSDIEKVCPRMLIIDQGRIIYDGSVAAIKQEYSPHRVLVVDFADQVPDGKLARAEQVKVEGRTASYRFHRHEVSASELIVELAGGYSIKDIRVEEPDIETIVREIYVRVADGETPETGEAAAPVAKPETKPG